MPLVTCDWLLVTLNALFLRHFLRIGLSAFFVSTPHTLQWPGATLPEPGVRFTIEQSCGVAICVQGIAFRFPLNPDHGSHRSSLSKDLHRQRLS